MSNQSTDWLSIREAAVVLGVSDLTVRRRIKDGRIAHRLVDGKYYVNLTAPAASARHPAAWQNGGGDQSAAGRPLISQMTDQHATDQEKSVLIDQGEQADVPASAGEWDLDALLSEHARMAEQAGRAAALEVQLRELSQRQHELQELTLTLSNRNGWLESRLEEREQRLKLLTDGHMRPWWKRFFRPGVAGA